MGYTGFYFGLPSHSFVFFLIAINVRIKFYFSIFATDNKILGLRCDAQYR